MRKKVVFFLIVPFLFLFLLSGCHDKNSELEQKLRTATIIIPLDSMELLSPILRNIEDSSIIADYDYTYVVYYDTITCAPCKLHQMGIWRSIMKNTKDIGSTVNYAFIFHPRKGAIEKFKNEYYNQHILLNCYLDSTGVIERFNPIIKESRLFHSFVLGKDNHIKVIGNASKNVQIERSFYEFIKDAK